MTRIPLRSPAPSATRVLALLCLLIGFSAPVGPGASASAAQRSAAPDVLDLAAMTLTPADLEEVGFDDYRLDFGRLYGVEDVAPMLAEVAGQSERQAEDTLDEGGFIRWYENSMYLPEDEDDPLGASSRKVDSYVIEFEDDDGAAEMFDIIEDESGDEWAEDLRGVEDFGDESEATRYEGDDVESLDLSFRLGNLHAGVRIVDWAGESPEIADVESLTAILLDRIESVLDDGGPGLSDLALRVAGEDVVPSEDTYLLLDGEALRFYYEESQDARDREEVADDEGMQNEYRVWQMLSPLGEELEDDVWYYLMLADFHDEDAASEWLAGLEDRVTDDPQFTNLEADDNAPVIGDESLQYTVEWTDGGIYYRSMAIRLGPMVALIDLQAPETPPADATEALAEAQLECLENGGCFEPQPLPSPVEAFIADLEEGDGGSEGTGWGERREIPWNSESPPATTPEPHASPTPEDTPDDRANEPAGDTYESPIYDYTLTYDPDVWSVLPEDDPAADQYEWVTIQSELSTVWIVGTPDYGTGEMGDCVATYLVDQDFDNSVYEAELIDSLLETPDRAYGSYTLEDQLLGTGNAYLYIECRLIAPEQTLVIMHFAMLDGTENEQGVPEAEVAAFENLISGLVTKEE